MKSPPSLDRIDISFALRGVAPTNFFCVFFWEAYFVKNFFYRQETNRIIYYLSREILESSEKLFLLS